MYTRYGIFLDDLRFPNDVRWLEYGEQIEWQVVRNSREFRQAINFEFNLEGNVSNIILSFDHDLQDFNSEGVEVTGYGCLKWFLNKCLDTDTAIPKCYFHTQNPIGKENMEALYKSYLKEQEKRERQPSS